MTLLSDYISCQQGGSGTNITIDTLCSIMNDDSVGDPIQRYAKVNSIMLMTSKQKCLDAVYENTVASLRNTSWMASASEGGIFYNYTSSMQVLFL